MSGSRACERALRVLVQVIASITLVPAMMRTSPGVATEPSIRENVNVPRIVPAGIPPFMPGSAFFANTA